MTKSTRNRVGCALLLILVIILSDWFFSLDLKIPLFDLPVLEAERQSIVEILLLASANDQLLGEIHYSLREAPYCLWGQDSWTYKSSRTQSELENAFEQVLVGWGKWSSTTSAVIYNSGSFFVEIAWDVGDINAAHGYVVRLMVNDPPTPQCAPD